MNPSEVDSENLRKIVNDLHSFQDAFIGFGGNQVREKVKRDSKWFVTSFHELLSELEKKKGKVQWRHDSVEVWRHDDA